MKKEMYRKVCAAAVPAMVVLGIGAAMAAQGFTGAIFSTNRDGSFVNGNVYDDDQDPYLNGGPRANAQCSATGLPDGDYFFQVTDPSGSVLLSADAIDPNRRITVTGGHIVAASSTHGQGSGRCNDVTVQLAPFGVSPNEGGEYKVWMTPVERYDAGGGGTFGFLPRYSKTDNFKIASAVDSDGDGIPDADDKCPTVYDPSNGCYTTK
jgi:hypothetical protein